MDIIGHLQDGAVLHLYGIDIPLPPLPTFDMSITRAVVMMWIAAFIGMAKRGPMLSPTRVLGFKDYERLFSEDTSQGEMTEQVQQFFGGGHVIPLSISGPSASST